MTKPKAIRILVLLGVLLGLILLVVGAFYAIKALVLAPVPTSTATPFPQARLK